MSELDKYRLPVKPDNDQGYMWIDYIALSALQFWPRNPKLHNESGLAGSINRFGVVTALILDENSQMLVAGEGRLEDLRRRKKAREKPPQRVIEHAGEWYIPVIRGVSFKTAQEAEAYLLADNNLTMSGGWDESGVAEMITGWADTSEDALEGTGFDEDDVADFLEYLIEPTESEPRQPPKERRVMLFKLVQAVSHHTIIEKTIEEVMQKCGLDRADAYAKICEVAADNFHELEEEI